MTQTKMQFQKLVAPWVKTYDRLIVSAIGLFDGVDKKILSARILLAPDLFKEKADIQPLKSDLCWGEFEVRSWGEGEFEELLDGVINGWVKIGDTKAYLPKDQNLSHPLIYPISHPLFGRNQADLRFPALVVNGGSRRGLAEKVLDQSDLDWHLRSLSPPFFDISDLQVHFRLAHPSQTGDQSNIELLIRPPISIGLQSLIVQKKARITLLAATRIDKDLVSLGYRTLEGPGVAQRSKIPSNQIRWNEIPDGLEGTLEVDVGDVPVIQCFLSYAGIALHQIFVFDPTRHLNMRNAIHSAFDPEREIVRRLVIGPKGTDSREFEDGIAMLLGMFGFSVTQHGRTQKLSNAPDMVAITPQGRIAVVECTVGLPGADDQFATVRRRTEAIRNSLAKSGWPNVQLMPVVISALPQIELADHKSEGQKQGILVMCKEDIESGLERVKFPIDADQMFVDAINRLKTPGFIA